jgi:hypothetical protein
LKRRTVTAELNALHKGLVCLTRDVLALGSLGKKRNNGDTGVTANNGNVDVLGVGRLDLTEETGGADDVKRGNTEEPGVSNVTKSHLLLLVEDTSLLVDLGEDGHGRVNGVGDDEDHGLGAVLSARLGEALNDGGVGLGW